MLKTITTTVLGLAALTASAQNGFTINGKLSGSHEGQKVMLMSYLSDKPVRDSAIVKNGSFQLKGSVDGAVKVRLTLKDLVEDKPPMTWKKMMAKDEQDFFLENKNFRITGSTIKTARIEGGGEAQADYQLLQSKLRTLQTQMEPLGQKIWQYSEEKNDKGREEVIPQLRALRKDMDKEEDAFIQQHPDSYVTLDLLTGRSVVIDAEKMGPLFNALSPRMKASAQGKKLGERLNMAMTVGIGKPAPNFEQNNSEGKPVSLASLKGKYVLLDFWASWCGPCRGENPNVVKVYKKFKDRNFEIIGVSLDDKKDAWLKAIEADGLSWIHVSDLQGWKNAVAGMYDVKAIPQNFLIGPDGIILAKNLHGEQLDERLSELIKN